MKCLGLDFYLACLRFNFLNLFLFVVLEILNHNLKYDLYLIFLHIWILLRELLNLPMLFVYQLGHRLTRLLCNRPFRGFNKTQILFPCHLAVGRDSEGWCGSSAVQQAERGTLTPCCSVILRGLPSATAKNSSSPCIYSSQWEGRKRKERDPPFLLQAQL